MIITEDFVFIHFPKNGGSFFRVCLKEAYLGNRKKFYFRKLLSFLGLYQFRYIEKYNINKYIPGRGIEPTFHSWCLDIPNEHQNKPIVSIIRNPFDRYVSQYKYGWWKNNTCVDKNILYDRYPHFPDLKFDDFIHFSFDLDLQFRIKEIYINIFKSSPPSYLDIGPYTFAFICFYFKNPALVLYKLNDEYILSEEYKNDMYNVEFLSQENLSNDLYNLLKRYNFFEGDINFIKSTQPINTSKNSHLNFMDYYSSELINMVFQKEKYLFYIFHEYNEFAKSFI